MFGKLFKFKDEFKTTNPKLFPTGANEMQHDFIGTIKHNFQT